METSDCSARFTYLENLPLYQRERPYTVLSNIGDGKHQSNLKWHVGPKEKVENIRDRVAAYSLDEHGFCFIPSHTNVRDWSSRDVVERDYLPETERLLQKALGGVKHVEFFDWRVSQRQ